MLRRKKFLFIRNGIQAKAQGLDAKRVTLALEVMLVAVNECSGQRDTSFPVCSRSKLRGHGEVTDTAGPQAQVRYFYYCFLYG